MPYCSSFHIDTRKFCCCFITKQCGNGIEKSWNLSAYLLCTGMRTFLWGYFDWHLKLSCFVETVIWKINIELDKDNVEIFQKP